jgi:hypothetical protein
MPVLLPMRIPLSEVADEARAIRRPCWALPTMDRGPDSRN